MYRFKIDKDKFIEDCALEINNYLMFMKSKNEYKVEVGKAKFNESAMFVMEDVSYRPRNWKLRLIPIQRAISRLQIISCTTQCCQDLPYLKLFMLLRRGNC